MRKKLILLLSLALAISGGVLSQVTVGSAIKPVEGAILDLKEFEPTAEGTTATKGLLLPRVELKNSNTLQIAPDSQSDKHVGTVVYAMPNASGRSTYDIDDLHPCALIPRISSKSSRAGYASGVPRGVVTWTGSKWEPLITTAEDDDDEDLDEEEFTLPAWVHPSVQVTNSDHEGNTYTYRYFGNPDHENITLEEFVATGGAAADYQNYGYWMTENLRSKKFAPQSEHPNIKLSLVQPSGGTTESMIYGYPSKPSSTGNAQDDTDYKEFQAAGLLYSAGAIAGAKDGAIVTTPNMQGICPDGWFLPSRNDWDGLIAYLQLPEQVEKYTNYDTEMPVVTNEVARTLATSCRMFMESAAVNASRSKGAAEGALALIAVGWARVDNGMLSNGRLFEYAETPNTGSDTKMLLRIGSAGNNGMNAAYYSFKSMAVGIKEQMISVRCRSNKNPKP